MSRPRILAIMGSGETSPTMARVHRRLLAQLAPPVSAVLLDTPYGFQENAAEITARAVEYFATNVGVPMEAASFAVPRQTASARATSMARLRRAGYVFAGPGSPSYALQHWRGTVLPQILLDKLVKGGIVTFASAAALTLGAFTVPVYEIYKVGADPTWLDGLDVLGPLGLKVAVVPHYDNAEGGTHDTRFCYLGEARLALLERQLPDDHFVLGVDSHTALILDFGTGRAEAVGRGGVTIRAAGRSHVLPSGTTTAIVDLAEWASRLRALRPDPGSRPSGGADVSDVMPARGAPLMEEVRLLEARFEAAVVGESVEPSGPLEVPLGIVLELEELLVSWSRDTDGSGEIERARGILRALIARLAGGRARRPDDADDDADAAPDAAPGVPEALLELLVELRTAARARGDWVLGDRIRDSLAEAGIALRDEPGGTTWHSLEDSSPH